MSQNCKNESRFEESSSASENYPQERNPLSVWKPVYKEAKMSSDQQFDASQKFWKLVKRSLPDFCLEEVPTFEEG